MSGICCIGYAQRTTAGTVIALKDYNTCSQGEAVIVWVSINDPVSDQRTPEGSGESV